MEDRVRDEMKACDTPTDVVRTTGASMARLDNDRSGVLRMLRVCAEKPRGQHDESRCVLRVQAWRGWTTIGPACYKCCTCVLRNHAGDTTKVGVCYGYKYGAVGQ